MICSISFNLKLTCKNHSILGAKYSVNTWNVTDFNLILLNKWLGNENQTYFRRLYGQEVGRLLGCTAVQTGIILSTFLRSVLPPSSTWNAGKLPPVHTALQPRTQPSSHSSPWEPEITLIWSSFQFILLEFSNSATTGANTVVVNMASEVDKPSKMLWFMN
jgi:hypothetical protein